MASSASPPIALTLSTQLGFALAFSSIFIALVYFVMKLAGFPFPVGNPTIVILILFMGGVQLISVGILGEWKEISSKDFFTLILGHTMQGYYGDPRHGGNRGRASWKMLGLPYPPIRGRSHYDLTKPASSS